ncbi:alpha/beta hydrolase [Flavobacterium sp. U410]
MKFYLFIFTIIMSTTSQYNYAKGDTMLLHYLVREPKVKTENPPLLLLLHGVGGNEKNLFAYADQFSDEFLVISARAPFTISEGRYRWFAVDFSSGKPVINAEEAEKSRTVLIQFINQLKEKHHFDTNAIYMGGFSQGAIMSFSVGLTQPQKLKGIIALSGRILPEIKPIIASKEKLKKLNALIIHGTQDNMLSIEYGRQSKAIVDELGVSNTYVEFNYAHTVTPETIQTINEWLRKH